MMSEAKKKEKGKIFWVKGNAIELSKKQQGGKRADSSRKFSSHRFFFMKMEADGFCLGQIVCKFSPCKNS